VSRDAPRRDGLVLSPKVAALLFDGLRLEALRLDVRGRNPEIDRTLWQWRAVAMREHQRAIESLIGTAIDESVADDAELPVMTSAQAAARAKVTTRAVRRAAAEGRLAGRRVGARCWLFDSAAVTEWIARRTA
jgi:excisionase family DNA binding protein